MNNTNSKAAKQILSNKELIVGLLALGGTPDIDRLFELIVLEAPRLVGARECSIFWKDGAWREPWRKKVSGPTDAFYRRATYKKKVKLIGVTYYKPGEGLTGWVAKEGKTVRIDDIEDIDSYSDKYPDIKWADKEKGFKSSKYRDRQRAFLAVPVQVDDEILGVIRIAQTIEPYGTFSDEDQDLLETFAEHIGNIITRVEEAALNGLWQELYLSGIRFDRGDFTSYLQRVSNEIPKFLGMKACSIFLLEMGPKGPELRLRGTTTGGPLEADVGRATYALGEGLTGWVAKNNQSLRLRDVDDTHELSAYPNLHHIGKHEEYVKQHSSFLAAPIYIEDTVLGVIRIAQDAQGKFFSSSDLKNLEYFARNLAVLVQNVTLFESIESQKDDALQRLGESQKRFNELSRLLKKDLASIQNNLPKFPDEETTGVKRFGPFYVDRQIRDKNKVFVGIPFSDSYRNVYNFAICPALEQVGMEPWIAYEEKRVIDIMRKVYEGIQSCDVAIVDISDWNANVLFELGILYEQGHSVILLKRHDAKVPTDLAGLEYIPYGDFQKLTSDLIGHLQAVNASKGII